MMIMTEAKLTEVQFKTLDAALIETYGYQTDGQLKRDGIGALVARMVAEAWGEGWNARTTTGENPYREHG